MSAACAPRLRVLALDMFERDVPFAKPFRFGSSIVSGAPQAFVRARIDVEGFGAATGATAEMMVPRWFDKRPEVSPAGTIEELRTALVIAREIYLDAGFETAFGHHAESLDEASRALQGEGHSKARGHVRPGANRQGNPRCPSARLP